MKSKNAIDKSVVSSCTGTQKKETLTNCVISPCMVMKTIGIPSCTGTPGQPRLRLSRLICLEKDGYRGLKSDKIS